MKKIFEIVGMHCNACESHVEKALARKVNSVEVSYKTKKGYSQKGDDMVYNNYGNHYAISGLGTQNLKGGGC